MAFVVCNLKPNKYNMDLSKRIFKLIQSYTKEELAAFQKRVFESGASLKEELDDFEQGQSFTSEPKRERSEFRQDPPRPNPTTSREQELIDDLAVFGLKQPATMAEVKKARNKEIKSYHPDHFASDPAKEEAAKKILQLYNNAYDRLEKRLT